MTVSMNEFFSQAQSVMSENGLSANTFFAILDMRSFSMQKEVPSIEFKISFFISNGTCKQVEGISPEICIEKMRLYFKEVELSKVITAEEISVEI